MEKTPLGYVPFDVARRSQADLLSGAIPALSAQVTVWRNTYLAGPGPIFVGIGASLAAACAPVWTLRERGIMAWRLGAGDAPLPYPSSRHPVIGISQSGRSAETLEVLTALPSASRLALVNMSPSPIGDLAMATIELGNLPDSYASTIGYTATIAALGLIADAWDGGEPDPGWLTLPEALAELEGTAAKSLQRAIALFAGVPWVDFVGAAPSAGSAEAGALLLREVARIPSTAMSTRQYLHGAIESMGGGLHLLLGDRREVELATALAGAGNRVILVTTEEVAEQDLLVVIRLPERPAAQRAILEASILQVIAGGVAQAREIDIEEFVFHQDDIKVPSHAPAL